jgi:hypothetical protein
MLFEREHFISETLLFVLFNVESFVLRTLLLSREPPQALFDILPPHIPEKSRSQ